MRQFSVFLCTLFFAFNLQAQIGVNAGYRTNSAEGWENFFPGKDFLDQGFKVGVDYWFRLKNRRVEFTPELSYTRFTSSLLNETGFVPAEYDFSASFIGFDFNTNFYILDFASDCDCPTWSKEGSILDAGLFIQVSPGLAYGSFRIENTEEMSVESLKSNDTAFKFGLGVGLDIGLNDAFTLTPLISWQRYFGMTWENLSNYTTSRSIPENADETTDMDQLFFGLKFQVRLDELRGY